MFKYFYQITDTKDLFMNHYVQPQMFISSQAKKLGIELINEFYIQVTARMAFYLEMNPCYDGHEATFIWINYYLEEHPDADYDDVRNAFRKCLPYD